MNEHYWAPHTSSSNEYSSSRTFQRTSSAADTLAEATALLTELEAKDGEASTTDDVDDSAGKFEVGGQEDWGKRNDKLSSGEKHRMRDKSSCVNTTCVEGTENRTAYDSMSTKTIDKKMDRRVILLNIINSVFSHQHLDTVCLASAIHEQ